MSRKIKNLTVQAEIGRAVRRIVRRFDPEQIILFGSHARGEATAESDVDLLVVMDFAGSKLKKLVELQGTVDDGALPLDILLTTPADFAWRKDVVGTIEWPASREGKVLYARAGRSHADGARRMGRKGGKRSHGGAADSEAR